MASSLISVLKARGLRYFLFRSSYEFMRKTGILKYKFPCRYVIKNVSLEEFRSSDRFFFASRESLTLKKIPNELLKCKFDNVLKGKIPFFSKINYDLGMDYDWITNSDTGYKYDIKQHWTKVEDIDEAAGDIKFVWEKSRFSYIYSVLRYDYHFDEDHSAWVFNEICDWIDKNPLNYGPNYKCSQEISIRILNWLFALHFYKASLHLTEPIFSKIIQSIYGQIKHVESNINFSRICVRNNHAITETLTLYLTSLMLPNLPGSKKRKRLGKKYFEEEIAFQIAEDGTFIQESMNYHRVVVQLLTWAIAISDVNGERFSDFVYRKAWDSVNFLFQCQDCRTGKLPNYGANDGALFFPLNDNDYRDYRPQLDALHVLLTGKSLYAEQFEDCGYYVSKRLKNHGYEPIIRKNGIVKFEKSGYYLFRNKELLVLIRCGGFNGEGGTNDQMHLDVWFEGKNILCDSGSYKYNASQNLVEYFRGTESQNCVMLSNYHLQKKGVRFVWYYPPIKQYAKVQENDGIFEFDGCVRCFRFLALNIDWSRQVRVDAAGHKIFITDVIVNKPETLEMRQIWHSPSNVLLSFVSTGEKVEKVGMCSDYYGTYRDNRQIEFVSQGNRVETIIEF